VTLFFKCGLARSQICSWVLGGSHWHLGFFWRRGFGAANSRKCSMGLWSRGNTYFCTL